MKTVLTFDFRNETGIEIWQNDDNTFTVVWEDYVANAWEESLPSLSLALSWLAIWWSLPYDLVTGRRRSRS